jgi:hypothetical protein
LASPPKKVCAKFSIINNKFVSMSNVTRWFLDQCDIQCVNIYNWCRMRAKEGPDACLSVTGESVVSRAIVTSAERPGQPIFYPYL